MLIENGGLASAQSVTVGSAAGSSGVVEVTGVGSRLTSESSIMIGVFGSGTMKIADGGVVTSDPGLAIVGFLDGSTGLLELTGTGSRLDTTSPLFIAYGSGSQGNLNILDGATMTSGEAQVGQEGTGNVHISGGGSTWQVADLFWVGSNGDGSVVVDGGGTLKSDIALVGHMAGSNGQILISGQGSSWNTPSIYLSGDYFGGNGGDSSLTINNGAIVKANNISMATGAVGSAVLNIGNAAGSAATAAGIIEGQSVTMAGDSTVVFNHTDSNYQFNPSIEGVGKVDIYSGTTLLNGSNSYAGTTTVAGGALQAGAAGAFSAASNYIVGRAGLLDLAGFSQTLNSLNNSGTVSFNGAPGTVLTINGDYTGNDGLLNFNSVLGADTSVTDKLVINGNTSGTTRVGVTNLGGSGAETLNGIELIAVNGLSDGEFVKQGRIVAGAYDYSLARGTGTNSGNWYLTSAVIPVDPIPPVDPVPPVDPAPPIEPINPAPMVERPEAGSYTANLAAANNLFVTSLNDRQGETQYIDALTGEHKVTSLWMRNEGGHNRSRDASGQLQTQSNRYVLQLGGDIAQWSYNNMDRFRLGMMAGYGNNKSNTHSSHSGYRSEGSVDGYTVGLYGTWYANDEDKSGLYVDSWAQYNWFNNSVQGEGLSREEYKSKGVTASVESGYTFNLGENADKTKTYFIQPKAQVTWMGVKADDHREANGTQVSGLGDGNIQTRLGARVYMKGQNSKGQEFQPFVETNWVHNTEDFGTMMNDTEVKQAGAKNIGELKLGIEGQISKRLNIWGNVGQQVGNKGYSDTDVMLGMQYNF
uniref:Autotransporter domain-containing protein n=1 Tax=Anopheles maculatus TaxID=74869 RepID=A0A182SXU4_9DIPT